MKKECENYSDVEYTLAEMRDRLEVIIHDCKESANEEENRIYDDAREARYYAEFLERLMEETQFSCGDKETLKFAVCWLYSIVKRKEEVQ